MRRLTWLTDLHLNHCQQEIVDSFLRKLADQQPDILLIGGDTGDSLQVISLLQDLQRALRCPVYFVLGNHDFYYGSLDTVRKQAGQASTGDVDLHYLTGRAAVEITPHVGLLGDDGWADGRIGDYERSMILMNDYILIDDLSGIGKERRWRLLQRFGDEAAARVREQIEPALQRFKHLIFLTHVPPFREACWYDGQISNDEWAPHFTCKAVGLALIEAMESYPDRRLTVLCGHTHGAGRCRPLPNLEVVTAGAEYGAPSIAGQLVAGQDVRWHQINN